MKKKRSSRRPASQENLVREMSRETKWRGETGEAAFLAKAASMGFVVAKPWGDSRRYDFIVDVAGRLIKVQVKSAHRACAQVKGGYQIGTHSRKRSPYRAGEVDLLVAYIAPENIWYVMPPRAFEDTKSMRFSPNRTRRTSKWEQYREAWHAFYEV
jgi:hypothetical protein